MTAPLWSPGTLKQPGDIVRPTSAGAVAAPGLDNPFFDDGDTGWTFTGAGSHTIDTAAPIFNGSYSAKLGWTSNPNAQTLRMINNARLAVTPGQVVTLTVYVISEVTGDFARLMPQIRWFNASAGELAPSELDLDPTPVGGEPRINSSGLSSAAANGVWVQLQVQGVAPAGAATATAGVNATWGDCHWTVDFVTFDYATQAAANNNLYRAVQASAGFTANVEPDWPTTIGNTIVDNEVTWQCVSGTSVTWQAHRILVSGSMEPTWPLLVNGNVPDNTITWTLNSRRVTDPTLPQSSIVALAASKIYAGDNDIVDYSATANPLDWSTVDDAGYLAFGLQTYGANPVSAMGLYRGNLAVFNAQGCQIWQVDEDPAAITILDAVPIPCTYSKSLAPVGDDLVFLSNLGIRSLGVAGSQINLQSGGFGRQIDPLVTDSLKIAIDAGIEPRGLYWPAQGQYWLFFGDHAFVHSVTGPLADQKSWARYTFPWEVTDWTILGEDLCLRAGDLVVKMSDTAHLDDQRGSTSGYNYGYGSHGVDGEPIVSVIQWPALDLGNFNSDKKMHGFDLSITGTAQIMFGWDQRHLDYDPLYWTPPYEVVGDTVTGQMTPLELTAPSISLRLQFTRELVPWKWFSACMWLQDLSK
jgi:hypothetical protein